jgi:hypothetical protein
MILSIEALKSGLGWGEGREGPLSAMDGAIEPYRDVFTGVSRKTLTPPQTALQRTHQKNLPIHRIFDIHTLSSPGLRLQLHPLR